MSPGSFDAADGIAFELGALGSAWSSVNVFFSASLCSVLGESAWAPPFDSDVGVEHPVATLRARLRRS